MKERSDLWTLRLMSWDRFLMATQNQSGNDWNLMTNADLVVGGVNFAADFL